MNRLAKAAVVALALTSTAAPLMAQAQSRDYRDDRRYENRYDNRNNYRPDYRPNHRDRRDYRNDYRNDRWDRNNRDWWRGRSDFRGYNGPRAGYWYAPSYGYYRVEPRYSSYRWQPGGYLPPQYRTYYVRDPYVYNLRPAPRGYRYVHAGNDIVLMAVATGLIASVMANVY